MSKPTSAKEPAPTTVTMTMTAAQDAPVVRPVGGSKKLHGRAFYESIGSPKYVVAPMVDQSEFVRPDERGAAAAAAVTRLLTAECWQAWRMLTRSFLPDEERKKMLAYTPMFHARLFSQDAKYRRSHFQAVRPDSDEPWLDGNPSMDRPLFVQFCANDPEALLSAAQQVAPYCDAVDLNLGCPQGIARKGHYGAFLQEDQDLIFRLINTLHQQLPVPVTAKIRILETKGETLAYARNVLKAGASILTVHGRRREQKGHLTGVADWQTLRYLRDSLPPETVLFANGNILQGSDLAECLAATGADGVMSAEGNLSDPALFATPPPAGHEGREYWRGKDGKGGWRVDAITRRYLDILHRYGLGQEPPQRRPLFVPGDDTAWIRESEQADARAKAEADEPARKRRKKEAHSNSAGTTGKNKRDEPSPNMVAVQPHLFHLLRHFVSKHTDVRDMLARCRKDGIQGYESVLDAVERRVAQGLLDYEATRGESHEEEEEGVAGHAEPPEEGDDGAQQATDDTQSSKRTVRRCKRPWWVAQPIVRPLPQEALAKGAIRPSRKALQASANAEAAAAAAVQDRPGPGPGPGPGQGPGPGAGAKDGRELGSAPGGVEVEVAGQQAEELAARDAVVSG